MSIGAFAGGLAGGLNAGAERKQQRELTDALALGAQTNLSSYQRDLARTQGELEALRERVANGDPSPPVRGARRPSNISLNALAPDRRRTGANDPDRRTGEAGSTQSGLYGLLTEHEGAGNPDTLFGHAQRDPDSPFYGVQLSSMSLQEVMDFTRPDGEYGAWVRDRLAASGQTPRIATPTGIGQIVGTTLRSAVSELGLDPNQRYDENTQRNLIEHLARRRLERAGGPGAAARRQMRAEWEGFKHVDDATLDSAINDFMGWGA